MKKYLIIAAACIWICGCLDAKPRFRETGTILDKITLRHRDKDTKTGDPRGRLFLYTQQNGCTDKMDPIDAYRMSGSIWSLSADSIPVNLFVDYRPYSGYYVDFPLVIMFYTAGEQIISYEQTDSDEPSLNVATAIELRNTKDKNLCYDLLAKGDYVFNRTAAGNDSTYFVRVWGANRVKENVANAKWNDPNSWLGVPPKPEIKNQYILIPLAASITIPAGGNGTEVDTINNEGVLTNENTLTVDRVFNTGTITNKGKLVANILHLGSNSSESN